MAFSPDGKSLGAVTWSGSTFLYSARRRGEPDCEAPASGDQLGLPNAQTLAAGAQQIAPELVARDIEGQCSSPVQAEPDHSGLDGEQCSGKAGTKSGEQALLGPQRAVRPDVQAQQAAQDGLLAGGSDSKGFQAAAADAASVPGKSYIGNQQAVSRLAWVDHGVRGQSSSHSWCCRNRICNCLVCKDSDYIYYSDLWIRRAQGAYTTAMC